MKTYPVENCTINDYFTDANEPIEERQKYCEKNCQFKCENNLEYLADEA